MVGIRDRITSGGRSPEEVSSCVLTPTTCVNALCASSMAARIRCVKSPSSSPLACPSSCGCCNDGAPRVQALRAAFDQAMAGVDPQHLIFVDETGATTAMTRTYGRAPVGQRVQASAPGAWQSVTFIAALRPTAVVAPFAFEGATDTLA